MSAPASKAVALLVERIEALSQRLRISDARFAQACDFLLLVITHRQPPDHLRPLARSVLGAASLRKAPSDAARELRIAARALDRGPSISPLMAMCGLVLREMAIQLDDSPGERQRMIEGYALLWDLSLDLNSPSLPRLRPVDRQRAGVRIHERHVLMPHIRALCQFAIDRRIHASPCGKWAGADWQACLNGLRLAYGSFETTLAGELGMAQDLLFDFQVSGDALWQWLAEGLVDNGYVIDGAHPVPWCHQARQMLLLELTQAAAPGARASAGAAIGLAAETQASDGAGLGPGVTLTVCRAPIVPSSDRVDVHEVKRHEVLEQPLPVVPLPKPAELEALLLALTEEFPWAAKPLDTYFGPLIGMAQYGVPRLSAPPTLLVGQPGAGKTRLALRLTQALGLPQLLIAAAGADAKALSGTSRGWASGRPNDVVSFIAQHRCASPAVIVDEIDKSRASNSHDGGLQPQLLALFEETTAARFRDSFLLTDCDMSAVIWLATANQLSPLSGAMKSRLRVLHVPQPRPEHFPAIARTTVSEFANQWGIPVDALPDMAQFYRDVGHLNSARMVRLATIHELTRAARSIRKH